MLKRALSARGNKQKGHFLDHGTSLLNLIYSINTSLEVCHLRQS